MALKNATHAQAMIDAKAGSLQTKSIRGTLALADLVCIPTTIILDGDEAADDVINLTAGLPDGLVLVPALSKAAVKLDPGTAFVVDIGNADNPDAYADGLVLSSAGVVDFGVMQVNEDNLPENQDVRLTVKTATALVAASVITFYLVFRAVS